MYYRTRIEQTAKFARNTHSIASKRWTSSSIFLEVYHLIFRIQCFAQEGQHSLIHLRSDLLPFFMSLHCIVGENPTGWPKFLLGLEPEFCMLLSCHPPNHFSFIWLKKKWTVLLRSGGARISAVWRTQFTHSKSLLFRMSLLMFLLYNQSFPRAIYTITNRATKWLGTTIISYSKLFSRCIIKWFVRISWLAPAYQYCCARHSAISLLVAI